MLIGRASPHSGPTSATASACPGPKRPTCPTWSGCAQRPPDCPAFCASCTQIDRRPVRADPARQCLGPLLGDPLVTRLLRADHAGRLERTACAVGDRPAEAGDAMDLAPRTLDAVWGGGHACGRGVVGRV